MAPTKFQYLAAVYDGHCY